MKLIKADHKRRLEIPGVPGLVRRPVDIDQSQTGFANLRTFRIYRFEAGSTIDGHAEEDEVFVVVLAGSIELTIPGDNSGGQPQPSTLMTANPSYGNVFAAYLPPHSAYHLVSKTDSDIAYARATPVSGPPLAFFTPSARAIVEGTAVLLDETQYAKRLRLRLLQIEAPHNEVVFTPIHELEAELEALVHVRTEPAAAVVTATATDTDPILLDSWDTLSVVPGDKLTMRVEKGSSALVLIVLAV